MQIPAYATQIRFDAERAREDSMLLWRHLQLGISDPPSAALNLPARYCVGDDQETAGEVSRASPMGLHIVGPKIGLVGDKCAADIPSLGFVEGGVVLVENGYFVMGIVAPPSRLRRLAQRLNWRRLRDNNETPERRASPRVEMNRATATLTTSEGRNYPCGIFDISTGGAAVHLGACALYFWVDQPVSLDGRNAHVLRYFPGGVVIAFD